MATDGLSIIREAALLVPLRARVTRQGGQTALTATGGSTSTLVDTAGFDFGASSTYYKRWWIWNVTQGLVRQVASSTPGSSLYTLESGTTWNAPVATDVYMLLRDHPEQWHEGMNYALENLLTQKTYLEWTPTDGDEDEYTLSAAPVSATGVTRPGQVSGVQYRPTSDSDARWEEWDDGARTWYADMDGSTVKLFFPDLKPQTSDRMRLTLLRQYSAVTDLTASIDVDLEWAARATLLRMARVLKRNVPGDEWRDIESEIAAPAYDNRRLSVLGTSAYRQVGRHSQRRGGPGVTGRGGLRSRRRAW